MLLDLLPLWIGGIHKSGEGTLVIEGSGTVLVDRLTIIQAGQRPPIPPEHPGFVFHKTGAATLEVDGSGAVFKDRDLVALALARRPQEDELLLLGVI